jgi:hypothetical protein
MTTFKKLPIIRPRASDAMIHMVSLMAIIGIPSPASAELCGGHQAQGHVIPPHRSMVEWRDRFGNAV